MVRIGRIASVRGILLSAVVMALSAPFAANGQDVPAASGVVPSVIGLPAKDAKAALVAAGLAPKFELGTEAGPGTDGRHSLRSGAEVLRIRSSRRRGEGHDFHSSRSGRRPSQAEHAWSAFTRPARPHVGPAQRDHRTPLRPAPHDRDGHGRAGRAHHAGADTFPAIRARKARSARRPLEAELGIDPVTIGRSGLPAARQITRSTSRWMSRPSSTSLLRATTSYSKPIDPFGSRPMAAGRSLTGGEGWSNGSSPTTTESCSSTIRAGCYPELMDQTRVSCGSPLTPPVD